MPPSELDAAAPVPGRPKDREPWLDLGRLLWIAGILAYHFDREFGNPFGPAAKVGGQGVYFFLFASGYGLARSSSAGMAYGDFLRRRLGKVMTPFWTLAAVFALVAPLLSHHRLTPLNGATVALGLTAFMPDDMPTAWWFITAILQCYLVFPLLVRVRRPGLLVAGVVAVFVARAAFATLTVPPGAVDPTYRTLPAVLPAFALGIALARANLSPRRLFGGWNALWVLGLEALGAGLTVKFAPFFNFNDLFFIPFAIAVPIWIEAVWGRLRAAPVPSLAWTPTFTLAVFLTHEWSLRRLAAACPRPLPALALFYAISIVLGGLGMLFVNRLAAVKWPTPKAALAE